MKAHNLLISISILISLLRSNSRSRYILLLLIIVLANSCQQKNNYASNLPVFNVEELWGNENISAFSVAKYVESVDYIPLETDSNILIDKGFSISTSENFFHAGEFLFNSKGEFLTELGKKGQGPHEFIAKKDVAMDEIRKEFYVLPIDGLNVMVYDMNDNSFKKSVKLSEARMLGEMFNLGNGLLLFSRGANVPFFKLKDDYFEYFVLDIDSEEIVYKRTSRYKELEEGANFQYGVHLNQFWYYNGVLQFYEHATDTVYSLNSRGEVCEPRYVIDRGKYKETIDKIKNNPRNANMRFHDNFVISFFDETDLFFRFVVRYNLIPFVCIFDKEEKKMYVTKRRAYKNDYDGILNNLGMNTPLVNKGYSIIWPEKIISSEKNGGYSDALLNNALKKLSMVEEDDNPIVVIINYKRKTGN